MTPNRFYRRGFFNSSFMTNIMKQILEHNKKFVENEDYKKFITDKYPDKKIAILTCMDTRLVELLPAALGIKNGDVKMIKNAGGVITDPFDSAIRSLLVAIYELGVNQIMVIGHTECGVQGMDGEEMIELMKERGINLDHIELIQKCGINLKQWLTGFEETPAAVADTVSLISNHPLIPKDVKVDGFIIDSVTGKLTPLE